LGICHVNKQEWKQGKNGNDKPFHKKTIQNIEMNGNLLLYFREKIPPLGLNNKRIMATNPIKMKMTPVTLDTW
jgi:hypothetical protein